MKKFNDGIDYYEVLGVGEECDDAELKKAYRKKALETHPDVSEDKSGEAFKMVNEAYEVLSDPNIRSRYDLIRGLRNHNYSRRIKMTERDMKNPQSHFEDFDSFYQDIFKNKGKARSPTPEEERRTYESKKRKNKEEQKEKAGKEERRKRKINQLWREGINKVMPYILRFPELSELKLDFYSGDWFRESFVMMYERDGSLFNEDVGIFNCLMNESKETDGKDLYKILMETRGGDLAFCEARIPLRTSNLSGLELLIVKKVPTKIIGGELYSCGLTNMQLAINSTSYDFQAATNLPVDEYRPQESLMQTCQFLAHLTNSIKAGDYEIKFSPIIPKKHEFAKNCGRNTFGLWIDSLRLGKETVIQDGEFIRLANGLGRISSKKPQK